MKVQRGFTLIELLIVVAIIGIIAVIAVPAYDAQVRKSRRGEAVRLLGEVALALERYRSDCPSYNSGVACTGITYPTMPTSDYYTVSVTASNVSTYTLSAAAKAGTSQAKDTGCTTITLNQAGTRSPTACWSQ